MHENRETCSAPVQQTGRSAKVQNQTADVYALQESDRCVVPVKLLLLFVSVRTAPEFAVPLKWLLVISVRVSGKVAGFPHSIDAPQRLSPGDIVRVGETELRFEG